MKGMCSSKTKYRVRALVSAVAGLAIARPAAAQCTAAPPDSSYRVVVVASASDDSSRLGALLGACWQKPTLVRTPMALSHGPLKSSASIRAVLPEIATSWNSTIPFSQNDEAEWAGRGWNQRVSGGLAASVGSARLVLVPELLSSQNLSFPILPSGSSARSGFASPFHSSAFSVDLPLRYGDQRYTRVGLGSSFFEIARSRVAFGLSAAPMWWGPGVRNALVMSNNAPGIPQMYLRTARPLQTRMGAVEAYGLLGMLTESPFFDHDDRNDQRALSAGIVTLRTSVDSGLTIGVARSVYSGARNFGLVFGHAADVITQWHQPAEPGEPSPASEQISSIFGRWIFAPAGLSVHMELARLAPPASLREIFVDPQRTQGYTIGLEWAKQLTANRLLRLQAEGTALEQTPTTPGGDVPQFYASSSVTQGYTQQGQVIGAAIGPGGSSQYLVGTLFANRWQLGLELGRVRWEDDAYYRAFPARVSHYAHDVSLLWAVSGRWAFDRMSIDASIGRQLRMNYLFQTVNAFDRTDDSFDVGNTSISVRISPHASLRQR
jgi:hypothetical protein